MINYVKNFGRFNSFLIGTAHNNLKYTTYIENLINKNYFDYYLIELNRDNLNFIKRNDVYFSEFYPIIKNVNESNIVLIDIPVETAVNTYSQIIASNDFFNTYISYKYNKYYFLKINNFFRRERNDHYKMTVNHFYKDHPFYKVFIGFREAYMLSKIKSYSDYKICVIIGLNHFNYIWSHLKAL